MDEIFKMNTNTKSMLGGALIGAVAGKFAFKGVGMKKGAIMGVAVAVLLPTGENIAGKVLPE